MDENSHGFVAIDKKTGKEIEETVYFSDDGRAWTLVDGYEPYLREGKDIRIEFK
mgnify:CR=1 FL=1|jgi:hypothetical protein